jgi:voltage-gated potassium channel
LAPKGRNWGKNLEPGVDSRFLKEKQMADIKRRLKIFLALFLLVTLLGTLGFMKLLNLSFVESIYYNIATMSTVGYGDIHPKTPEGMIFTVFLIVMGGTTFLGVIANATELLMVKRENTTRAKKVNMVLGTFFSEIGYHLIALFSQQDKNISALRPRLLMDLNWGKKEFKNAKNALSAHAYDLSVDPFQLKEFCNFLVGKRQFLIDLIENPVLLENEGFSETLLALFHLMDELNSRENFENLPESDIRHLAGDFNRAYKRLAIQWIDYLEHLKEQYAYLFSLAARKNPFNPNANPIVQN